MTCPDPLAPPHACPPATGGFGRSGHVAIMQPYFFPSLGYFQLVAAAEAFCFFDDVNFIKGGWINRNRILQQGKPAFLTVPLQKQSQNVPICTTLTAPGPHLRRKIAARLRHGYADSPRNRIVTDLVMSVVTDRPQPVADLAAASVETVCDHIGLRRRFWRSSHLAPETRGIGRVARLAAMTRQLGGQCYVNAAGGRALYTADAFAAHGLNLRFLEPVLRPYPQRAPRFVPNLSIIDVLMAMPADEVREMAEAGVMTPG